MPYHRLEDALKLALMLRGSATGFSLGDMQVAAGGCSRRTAERLRDALVRVFPQIEERIDDDGRTKRWRLPPGTVDRLVGFSAEELLELNLAAADLRRAGLEPRARAVEQLAAKLRGLLRPPTLARVEPDLEALLAAEGFAVRPGPRPRIRAEVLAGIRNALKAGTRLRILYRKRRDPGSAAWRAVEPLGLLYGQRHHLVAALPGSDVPRLWALAGIEAVKADFTPVTQPAFNLQSFAAKSFGVWQGPSFGVVWRFPPGPAAADARLHHFHPSEVKEEQADGGLIVRFEAAGDMEMAWHLFQWSPHVSVIEPAWLRDAYLARLEAAAASIRP
jgi:predicted DNA-binding transcriptional regulator YafY